MPIGRSRALSTVRSNSVDHGRKTNRPRLGPAGSTVRPSRHPPEQVRQPGPLTVTHVPRVDASPERLLAVADQLAEGDAAARELSAAYRRLAQIPDEDTRRRLLIKLERRRRQLKEDQTRLAADARRILVDRRADLFRGDLEVTRAEMELRRLDPDAETLLRRLGRTSLPDGGPRRPEDHDRSRGGPAAALPRRSGRRRAETQAAVHARSPDLRPRAGRPWANGAGRAAGVASAPRGSPGSAAATARAQRPPRAQP